MLRIWIAISLLIITSSLSTFSALGFQVQVYQCRINGQTVYSQTPCSSQDTHHQTRTIPTYAPSEADHQRALAQNKKMAQALTQIERERAKEEAKALKIVTSNHKAKIAHQQKCEKAQEKLKDFEANNAYYSPKKVGRIHARKNRLVEKAKNHCAGLT